MQAIIIFLKGLLMGFADVVPGVSGGTMAFITGIYDRFIGGLSDVGDAGKLILTGKFSEGFKKIDFSLFIPLGLGIVVAFGIGSHIIPELIERYPANVYGFFIGLVLSSAYIVYKKIEKHNLNSFVFGILGFVLGLTISLLPFSNTNANPFGIFLLGIIAISAMLLPGISGSYILLMFGQYEFMLNAIRHLEWLYVGAFSIGAAIGLLLFSRILKHLLRKYHSYTFSVLLGIMLGALYRPSETVASNMESVLIVGLLFIFGIFLVILVEKVAKHKT